MVAVGVIGVVAYKAWQRRKAGTPSDAPQDDGETVSAHDDALLAGAADIGPVRAPAQSSPGFGVP